MSESPQQKTKRTYKKRLLGNNFKYQYSIFYQSIADSLKAIESGITYRRAIARKYRNQPFLWRLSKNLSNKDLPPVDLPNNSSERVEMIYWTFFTTEKIPFGALDTLISVLSENDYRLKVRAVSEKHLLKMANTIDRQNPHDLNSFFGLDKVNRMHCANKDKFTEL